MVTEATKELFALLNGLCGGLLFVALLAYLIFAKQREGATGTVTLYFRKELSQFRDLEIQRTELEY